MQFWQAPACRSGPRKGRQIVAGFSYLQRIGKGGGARAWIPEPFIERGVEWAAVREFELLQEAGNLAIDDLEVTNLKKAFLNWNKMRAGGYRVVLITLGRYTDDAAQDDLKILDEKLQEEITRMVHFLYLGDLSAAKSALRAQTLNANAWRCADALPHVAQALGARRLYKPGKETTAEKIFFDLLQRLPQKHIVHDMAVGLALPDATKDNLWVYIAKGEHRAAAFFSALGETMGEVIHMHMRGYGDRLKRSAADWQKTSVRALMRI